MIPNYLLFAIIWGMGGPLHESKRQLFNDILHEVINGENIYEKCKMDMRIPLKEGQEFESMKLNVNIPADVKNLFDIYYDDSKLAWINWVKTIPLYLIPKNEEYSNIIVPTADSIRLAKLMEILIVSEKHVLFCGPTGTGKTISINK
jgi:dynein heavy chain